MTWKTVPTKIGILDRQTGKFHVGAPVTGVKIHPVGAKGPIREDWHMVEITTPYGVRRYGFVAACIDSRLRAVVKLGPGQERDEVVAKWPKASPNACKRQLGRARKRRKARR